MLAYMSLPGCVPLPEGSDNQTDLPGNVSDGERHNSSPVARRGAVPRGAPWISLRLRESCRGPRDLSVIETGIETGSADLRIRHTEGVPATRPW